MLSASGVAAGVAVAAVELTVKGATFDVIRFCCVVLSAGNVTVITCLLAEPTVDSVSDTEHKHNVTFQQVAVIVIDHKVIKEDNTKAANKK